MDYDDIESANNDRFDLTLDGFNIIDEGEKITKKDLKEYFETQRKMMLTIDKPLQIGDVVMLKYANRIVRVTKIDVEFDGKIISQYGGHVLKESTDKLFLFDQEDISEILYEYSDINKTEKSNSRHGHG